MGKGSGLDSKNYWENSLVGMRREGEFKISRVSELPLCEKWCNQREKEGEGHLIGVVYIWSMNSCLLMRQLEKIVV